MKNLKKLEFSNQKLNLQDEYISKLEAKIKKLEDTIIGIAEYKNELLNTDSNKIQIQELTKKYGKKCIEKLKIAIDLFY
jgi:hypothetical protein